MSDRPVGSLGSRRTTGGDVLVDLSCGRCAACAAGASLWCTAATSDGRDLTPVLGAGRAPAVASALRMAAALAAAPVTDVALVLADAAGPTAVLLRALYADTRLVFATDPVSARAELADQPTGRAGVVVTGAHARDAVRAVRRGGRVCVAELDTAPDAELPSVTELVQREVTLLAPLDVAAVAARVSPDLWPALVAA